MMTNSSRNAGNETTKKMTPSTLTGLLHEKALELGFELVGTIPVSPSKSLEIYKKWLQNGYAGSMEYLQRHAPLKEDPRRLLPETLSLIALGINYHTVDPPAAQTQNPALGRISRYAWGDDYHDLIRAKLRELESFICEQLKAGKASRSFVDSGPVLEREIAQRAGLGWIGKNANLIHRKRGSSGFVGSWFFLAELLIDAPLTASLPFSGVGCGTCTRCLEACPTGAIVADKTVDARRCISYLTIELKDAIPAELRPQMGNWIFGCDICQEVCPWNRKAPESCTGDSAVEQKFLPRPENIAPELSKLMNLSQEDFSRRFHKSPIKRAKRRGFLRNVAVALGNWGDPEAIPALREGLEDGEFLVRIHAAWALGRIDDLRAKSALEGAKTTETHPQVLQEIEAALEK